MIKKFYYLLFFFIVITNFSFAQNVSCSDFNFIGIRPDQLNSNQSLIDIEFTAPSNVYVTYPHVSYIIDCNGDTIADGIIFYPGYFGDSTYYHPTSLIDTLACLPLTIAFVFTNDLATYDTCYFNYNVSNIFNPEQKKSSFTIYPNPSKGRFNIQVENSLNEITLSVYDVLGKAVFEQNYFEFNSIELDLSKLDKGIYQVVVSSDSFRSSVNLIKE